MKRCGLLPLLLLGASGCLTPITGRLDRINDRLEDTKQQLVRVTAQLDESNRELARANQKLAEIERLLKRFPGLGQNVDLPPDPHATSGVPSPLPPAETPVLNAAGAPGDSPPAPLPTRRSPREGSPAGEGHFGSRFLLDPQQLVVLR
jgi:hypothetical protein